jgi:hypothetical protein
MKHYLAIGRIIGDDEDTPLHLSGGMTRDDVLSEFREYMLGLEGLTDDGHTQELEGIEIVLNQVFVSEAPIEELQ